MKITSVEEMKNLERRSSLPVPDLMENAGLGDRQICSQAAQPTERTERAGVGRIRQQRWRTVW